MDLILFDTPDDRRDLRPFSETRALGQLRNGILTQAERWERRTGLPVRFFTIPAVMECLPEEQRAAEPAEGSVFVLATWVATAAAAEAVLALEPGEVLVHEDSLLAIRLGERNGSAFSLDFDIRPGHTQSRTLAEVPRLLERPWHLFLQARQNIIDDFALVTEGRQSQPILDPHTRVYGQHQIFLEEGATVRAALLDAEDGPIYIGRNARVEGGAMIHSAHAILEGATVNMGAKLRGDSIIGPYCKVGGEVANSVLTGFSNKGHDGYLGNSVLGEWCNLGADTNTSNLKNNYSNVRIQYSPQEASVDTGQLFCGLLLGDHSKAGINTMFNTGTVVGVGCSLFGGGYMPKSVGNFSWGGEGGRFDHHKVEQMLDTERRVFARRKRELPRAYERLLRELAAQSQA